MSTPTADARERLWETIENALQGGTDYDPNGERDIVSRIVDALISHTPEHAGWMTAYGRVYRVVETDMQDSNADGHSWTVYTKREADPSDE